MTDIKQGSTKEIAMANSGAAPFVNRVFVAIGPVVRITFAEQWGRKASPHSERPWQWDIKMPSS